ncbi:MAG: biotin-dependent carboxyltransferase, partial [Frankiales bacterium]
SGLGPAPLAAGDRLPIGSATAGAAGAPEELPEIAREPVLRVVPGPRDDAFVPGALDVLTRSPYVVSTRSDRTGVRLEGAVLQRVSDGELPSEGVVPGAVQVPPDGQPILFLANCPTTGGYPVVGVVLPADLAHAAQARPGTRLRFSLEA